VRRTSCLPSAVGSSIKSSSSTSSMSSLELLTTVRIVCSLRKEANIAAVKMLVTDDREQELRSG